MNLLESILQSQGGGVLKQLAQSSNMEEGQAATALSQLVPALTAGLRQNAAQGGIEDLLGALSSGSHDRCLDQPELLATPESVQDGNGILGHILGGKDASRALAGKVSANTGIGEDALKRLLPLAATLVMGHLSKSTGHGSAGAGGLMSLLDADRDGSVVDDVMGMLGNFLKK